MFWNRTKLPITKEDKIWIEEDLNWLRAELAEEHFQEIRTVCPTKEFFDRDFDGTEKDAEFILERCRELMKIGDVEIVLDYFMDGTVFMDDGNILSSPADINGSWQSAAGTFETAGDKIVISIERGQLKNPISLIATISHELSNQILLGEGGIEENDELLTDLTSIVYGFGVFLGNSRFKETSFYSKGGEGWEMTGQGYLPEQIISYAMAWLCLERNENTDFTKFLDKTPKKYFDNSLAFLQKQRIG